MWCVPKITNEFVERMEDVLDLYEKPHNPEEPVVCFDEKSKQLLEDTRTPIPAKPGNPLRRDYEYKRNGTRNIFCSVEPKGAHREITDTARRTKQDFSFEIRRIVTTTYKKARKIHFVLDNLNTHCRKSLRETFGPRETRRLMQRICFHHTPKHASWLNMAEIELSILGRQCLNRRIPTQKILHRELISYENRRNQHKAMITWKFTKRDARRVFKYDTEDNRQN